MANSPINFAGEREALFLPGRLMKTRAGLDQQDHLHHGDVGIARHDPVRRFSFHGEADGVFQARF